MRFYACHPYRKSLEGAFPLRLSLYMTVLLRAASKATKKTAGGLIIPDNAKEKPQETEVVSVDAGAKDDAGARIAMDDKAADRLLFSKWSGTEIKLDGEELMITKESDILSIMA